METEPEVHEITLTPSDKSWTIIAMGLFMCHRMYVRAMVGEIEGYEAVTDFDLHRESIFNKIAQSPNDETVVLLLPTREYESIVFAHMYALVFLDEEVEVEGQKWVSDHYYDLLPEDIKAATSKTGLNDGLAVNAVRFLQARRETPEAEMLAEYMEEIDEMLVVYKVKMEEKVQREIPPVRKQFPKRAPKATQRHIEVKPTQGTKSWWVVGIDMFRGLVYYQNEADGGIDYLEEMVSQMEALMPLVEKLAPLVIKNVRITLSEDEYRGLTFAINYTVCALMTDEGEKWFFENYYPYKAPGYLKNAFTAEETLHEFMRFSDFFFRQVPPNPVFVTIKQEVKSQVDEIFPVEE